MPKSVIAYDKDLPEIPGRRPWERPTSYLIKDEAVPTGWREENSGRRPSRLLLVKKIRAAVDAWREQGYEGASEVTRRLFEYWFDEDHDVEGFSVPFRYYFCQREAIETLIWLVEIYGRRDSKDQIQSHAEVFKKDLFSDNIVFQTTMDGRRQISRYVPELDRDGVQDLPPEDLRRFAFKMATGSGKTWVMAMAVVWAYFHKKWVPDSELSTNSLIIAPNVIVYQRLAKDFASNAIFRQIPLVPPEWKPFEPKVILRGEATEPDAAGNLFLTNIHQLYESRAQEWTPQNAVDAILGRKPAKDLAAGERSMLERIKSLKDLVVMNDEAHHVHDEDLAWSQSLLAIHRALPKGISLWLDVSATPKDQNGMYYPWTVCDYPLAQAVEDRIVKAPLIVTKEDDPKQPKQGPDHITKENVMEKYGYWIRAAVQRWKDHWSVYKKLDTKPVLFIMAEKNVYADALGEHLWETKEYGFKQSEIRIIHTDSTGEVTKAKLEEARELVRDIDQPDNKIKVIVSVMMLREGWDVRNVTVVLGLRPFTAKAEILPEQVIGRGLRLMPLTIGPDRTQTLEVLGTRNLLHVLRTQLEAEGVGVTTTTTDPPKPLIIAPVLERLAYDIGVPLTKPRLIHDLRKISDLNVAALEPIFDQEDLEEVYRVSLKLEFATTETEIHQADITLEGFSTPQSLLGSITNKVIDRAKLPNRFAELYPYVREYVATRCFGREVDLESESIRSHLSRIEIQEGIAKYLARKISELTVDRRAIEFERADFKLSETKPFSWRRNLPLLVAQRTIFNYVATYNDYERRFAQFLDKASDVLRFAALGTTEQGESGTQFRVDYLKPNGAIGFYHPDWVVVQKTNAGELNWIRETKGRVWEGTKAKDEAIDDWCARITQEIDQPWKYVRIDQILFDGVKPKSLAELIEAEHLSGGDGLFQQRG
jgi:type III restriction enzyme